MCFSKNRSRLLILGVVILAFCAGAMLRFPQTTPAVAAPPTPATNAPGTWFEFKTKPSNYASGATRGTETTWVNLDQVNSIRFYTLGNRNFASISISASSSGTTTENPEEIAFLRAYVKNRRIR